MEVSVNPVPDESSLHGLQKAVFLLWRKVITDFQSCIGAQLTPILFSQNRIAFMSCTMEAAWNKSIPSFLSKLWSLVEDPALDELVCWSQSGQSFYIRNEQIFSKEVLPKYFKHNNMSSFVRQLNLYGFRKVISFDSVFHVKEKKNMQEFQHPFFQKGKTNLVGSIKRKVPGMRNADVRNSPDEFQGIMTEMQEINEKQNNMEAKLAELEKKYATLFLDMTKLTQKFHEQQQLTAQMEIFKNGYDFLEDNNKILIDNGLPILKDESKNSLLNVNQASGNDGKNFEVSIQNIPMRENLLTIDWGAVKKDCKETVTKESFGQETKDASLELVSSSWDNNLILTKIKSDTSYKTIMKRNETRMQSIEANVIKLKSLLSRKKMNDNSEHANKGVNVMNIEEKEKSLLEANGNKDKQGVQNGNNPLHSLIEKVPISNLGEKLQYSNDHLLDNPKNPTDVSPNLGNPQEDFSNHIEIFETQLLVEISVEYELLPILCLSIVPNLQKSLISMSLLPEFTLESSQSSFLMENKQGPQDHTIFD
ncbi:heat shock factor protein 3-like [Lepus europaeus]|uniref:heat shock factor protein 3-like n=1 Tax=Lepus europaeus TaxID=9983 RepID=UPI002B483DF8|nr:heat shock factor protein 3-like [Lepus europaeus]